MNTDGVAGSLQKKIGPLPVWAWAIIAGVLIYVIRNRMAGGTSAAAAAQQQQQQNPTVPQTPIPLSPGQSVYDPNTGSLYTPTAGPPESATGASLLKLITALLMQRGGPHGNGHVNHHKHHKRPPRHHHRHKPKSHHHPHTHHKQHRGHHTQHHPHQHTPHHKARHRGNG